MLHCVLVCVCCVYVCVVCVCVACVCVCVCVCVGGGAVGVLCIVVDGVRAYTQMLHKERIDCAIISL